LGEAYGADVKRVLLIGGVGAVLLVAAGLLSQSDKLRQLGAYAGSAARAAASAVPRTPAQESQPVREPAPGTPGFDVVRVNPRGDAVIAGRAAPDAEVTVLDGGRVIGTAKADQRGEWVLLPGEPLAPGGRELSLTSRVPGSDAELRSEDVVVLVVPEPFEDVAGRPADGPGEALALVVPREGAGPSTVLQTPGAPRPAESSRIVLGETVPHPPGGVSVDVVDYSEKGTVTIGGRAQPGMEVQVYLDNVLAGRSTTDAEGRWRLHPDRPIEPGRYTLRADQVGREGRVTARAEIPFQMADLGMDLPAGQAVVVQPGNSLWRLARRTYGSGVQYTLIYDANQEQIRDPHLIYPGQIFALPAN
jgi:hypothetical protein